MINMAQFRFDLWLLAEEKTEFHRQQIQGFLYGENASSGQGNHVVRDCLKNAVLWESGNDDGQNYEALHEAAAVVIKHARLLLVIEAYNDLMKECVINEQPVNYMHACGDTIEEMRENVRNNKSFHDLGDSMLVWVNEGDLWNKVASGGMKCHGQ